MESKLNVFLDPNFKFVEDTHTYTYLNPSTGKPVQIFDSVTKFLTKFKEPFDSVMWSRIIAKRQGTTADKILEQWNNKGKTATDLGSALHKWIEDFYNGIDPKVPENFKDDRIYERIKKFKELYESRLHKLTPVHQEFRLFSRKWNLAGTTDAIFKMNSNYYVGDWKTNEKFTTNDHPKGKYKKLLYPFEDLWDNSLNTYSIQLSLYRLIMEEESGFITNDSFLVWIGPEKPSLYKAVDLRDRLYTYLQKNNDLSL